MGTGTRYQRLEMRDVSESQTEASSSPRRAHNWEQEPDNLKIDYSSEDEEMNKNEKRFWFQRSNNLYNPDAIATQPSVYDDPETAEQYRPGDDWENVHRFDPDERWTIGEEHQLIRKIDRRIMVFAAIMFIALELDRPNISQALTDNFLEDLGMTTNDFNLGSTALKLAFLCAELPSQLVAKWLCPDIWIPTQMIVWSIIILYLSYFYKHGELSVRLGFFWTTSTLTDVLGDFFAFGILHMSAVEGKSGWRWLFLIEGLIMLGIGVLAYVLMPYSPTSTASYFRGASGWFTEREEKIMVNRILREDPSKGFMHNREPLTISLLDMGFDTFKTNLLLIPTRLLSIITMLGLTYSAEIAGELTFIALIAQPWALPFIIFINLQSHPIQVGLISRNRNSVRSRVVSAALYNMSMQTSGIISANIYRTDDAPLYHRGNTVLLVLTVINIFLYLSTKLYYAQRNRSQDRKWAAMSEDEILTYMTTKVSGNKRLDFRFAH
ncbi:MFS general substrate transporter [Hyaloscypha hepaticicola]|uniref:MFS general substrate transporter n=1 Tax=Hyaloscypha hepaticicola TaxID=2082293 RepID=A0A2J6Q0Z7_9HELO|nr:MFS general substrate transporter [Hyaloscypha hepaticicola]